MFASAMGFMAREGLYVFNVFLCLTIGLLYCVNTHKAAAVIPMTLSHNKSSSSTNIRTFTVFTSADGGPATGSGCPSVSLYAFYVVCLSRPDCSKSQERISIKFSVLKGLGHRRRRHGSDFDDDSKSLCILDQNRYSLPLGSMELSTCYFLQSGCVRHDG